MRVVARTVDDRELIEVRPEVGEYLFALSARVGPVESALPSTITIGQATRVSQRRRKPGRT